jgi:TonB family protein
MGREIKGFIIGALVSGGIHCALFFAPISPISAFPHVQEIPGSIEISLGAQHQESQKRTLTQEKEINPPHQKIETLEQEPSPQTEDRVKDSDVTNDPSGKSNPDRGGDTVQAISQEGNPKPPYPEVAWRRGYEGTVRLKVEVLASGKVGRIWVKESSGYEILDHSALKTIQDWRFIPARFSGIPVKSTVIVPVTFELKDRL